MSKRERKSEGGQEAHGLRREQELDIEEENKGQELKEAIVTPDAIIPDVIGMNKGRKVVSLYAPLTTQNDDEVRALLHHRACKIANDLYDNFKDKGKEHLLRLCQVAGFIIRDVDVAWDMGTFERERERLWNTGSNEDIVRIISYMIQHSKDPDVRKTFQRFVK